jgi:hypothetical protein
LRNRRAKEAGMSRSTFATRGRSARLRR